MRTAGCENHRKGPEVVAVSSPREGTVNLRDSLLEAAAWILVMLMAVYVYYEVVPNAF